MRRPKISGMRIFFCRMPDFRTGRGAFYKIRNSCANTSRQSSGFEAAFLKVIHEVILVRYTSEANLVPPVFFQGRTDPAQDLARRNFVAITLHLGAPTPLHARWW